MIKSNQFIPCEYTKNMYMSEKSSLWTIFNIFRVNIIEKIIKSIDTKGMTILEIGSYDFYFIYFCLTNGLLVNTKDIDMSDLYDDRKDFLLNETVNNLSYFEDNYKGIKFSKLSENLENFNTEKSYDLIFIFETLEHVIDENKCIDNLYKLLNNGGKVIVSVPIEYGLLFFIKDLGRRFIIKKDYHSLKELIYGLFGMINKIKRVPRGHKGYDYKNTKKILIEKGFKLKEQKIYPFDLGIIGYGVVWGLEK